MTGSRVIAKGEENYMLTMTDAERTRLARIIEDLREIVHLSANFDDEDVELLDHLEDAL